MKHFQRRSQSLGHKVAQQEDAAAAAALANAAYEKKQAEKRRVMSRKLKEDKLESANFKRLVREAKARKASMAAATAQAKLAAKHLTAAEKKTLRKTMETNQHCKAIIRNLKALRKVMSVLQSAIGEFAAMEAELSLEEMEAQTQR